MVKPVSLLFLTLLVALSCTMYFTGQIQIMANWLDILKMRFAFSLFVVYLFLYWVVIEVKNSYLEWKYLEEK